MHKNMFEISVYTEEGNIVIDGREPGDDEQGYGKVSVPPEQVEVLVNWLNEAKKELLANKG